MIDDLKMMNNTLAVMRTLLSFRQIKARTISRARKTAKKRQTKNSVKLELTSFTSKTRRSSVFDALLATNSDGFRVKYKVAWRGTRSGVCPNHS